MNIKAYSIILILLTSMLCGCVSQEQEIIVDDSISAPERMSFTAPLMFSDSNNTELTLDEYISDDPVLLIWVAAGCMGCHSWTDIITEEVNNGNISNSSLLSIHRYPSFESNSYVEEVYGNHENATNPVSWPLVLPPEDTAVIDLDSGLESQLSFYDSFGYPSTPTLQIMDNLGKIIWTSKTYWPTVEILDEIKNIIN
ncbi:hypothetical protein OAV46_00025 [Euryarchaeota archaeon]|nr:hypothetical protein [Candidatus Thalassarchaeum sp.]MDB4864881.1 hypothetical protein [Euryarchaeota archaeon]MDC0852556.1 hypothetical protein [Euryarchaeota archaeon]MDC1029185.1 hypothetical protein [Euryarchaeota archaeon]MDC3281404.1 hypothetical protein [Euryarchaeota archaeon]